MYIDTVKLAHLGFDTQMTFINKKPDLGFHTQNSLYSNLVLLGCTIRSGISYTISLSPLRDFIHKTTGSSNTVDLGADTRSMCLHLGTHTQNDLLTCLKDKRIKKLTYDHKLNKTNINIKEFLDDDFSFLIKEKI